MFTFRKLHFVDVSRSFGFMRFAPICYAMGTSGCHHLLISGGSSIEYHFWKFIGTERLHV